MTTDTYVELCGDQVQIDAAVIADALGVEASAVCGLMRAGDLTSLCERGVREDEGRLRLTFFYHGKRLRVTVDQHGRIIGLSSIDFGERPLPARLRGPQP
jgi:Family of unknown function (DUF6522)